MTSGGSPAQPVCTMTCTSEISGRASSGTCRNDQMPASVSISTAVNTRKRFRAQASMIRDSMLHPVFGVDTQLLGCDRLSVLLGGDRDLPSAARRKDAGSFIEPVALAGELCR